RQKWENLFVKRDLVYKTACKEFYKNLIVSVSLKKEIARSSVQGVKIEFDGITLASILDIPENKGICDYVEEIFEESKFGKRDVASFMDLTYMDYRLTRKELERRKWSVVARFWSQRKSTSVDFEWEKVEEVVEDAGSDSMEKFFDAEEGETTTADLPDTPVAQPDMTKKGKGKDRGVDPSGTIPDSTLLRL
ncbi:hypothetical protein Dimus_017704, partial [Dionaea muscipula]